MVIFVFKMIPWLVITLSLVSAGPLNIMRQQTSESSEHDQAAILKQIRKMNDDGSYTFGYEADDGSFKVETRDVLGNVKGTFGFVDVNGEIKRVTYSSSNGTDSKSTTLSPLQERLSVIQSILSKENYNSTASLKKLNSMLFSTTEVPSSLSASSKSSVIQSIPIRNPTTEVTAMPSVTVKSIETTPKTIFGQYLRNSKNRSRQFIHKHSQKQHQVSSVNVMTPDRYSKDQQSFHSINPVDEVKAVTLKNNYLIKTTLDDALQPIGKFKGPSIRSEIQTDNFRNQIDRNKTIKVRESYKVDDSNEKFDIRNERLLSTSRPFYTTIRSTTPSSNEPKVIQPSNTEPFKLHHRSRPQRLQSSSKDLDSDKLYNYQNENIKSFDKDKVVNETPEIYRNFYMHNLPFARSSNLLGRFTPADNFDTDEAQPDPNHQQENYRDSPLKVILVNTNHSPLIRNRENVDKIPMNKRILMKVLAPAQYIHDQFSENKENVEYVVDNNPPESTLASMSNVHTSTSPAFVIRKKFNKFDGQPSEQDTAYYMNLSLIPQLFKYWQKQYPQYQQQKYQLINAKDYLQNYFHQNVAHPSEPPNPINPPLSQRNLQVLLRDLLTSGGIPSLDRSENYLQPVSENERSGAYQNLPPHFSLIYKDHSNEAIPIMISNKYDRRMIIPEPDIPKYITMASAPLGIVFSANLLQDPKHSERINKNGYDEPVTNFNDDVIRPPPLREALLLRVLQLAMDNKKQSILNNSPIYKDGTDSYVSRPIASRIMTIPNYRKTGPTRSVQIIGDEKSDEYDDIKKKL